MPAYSVGHAALARHQFLVDQGYAEVAINAWSPDGWLGDGPDRFVDYDRSDSELGKVACKVQFLNADGGAEVTFAGGDGGVVNIGEEEDDDANEEDDEEEDNEEELEDDEEDSDEVDQD